MQTTPNTRILSLDQFRGYTIVGMFFVNLLGGVAIIPEVFKHHGVACSYADTIMPQFFFAVGFAYRLTFMRSFQRDGARQAYRRWLGRALALIYVGLLYHGVEGIGGTWAEMTQVGFTGFFTKHVYVESFQTLTHIGVTTLWLLPVIGARPLVQLLYLIGSVLLHLGLSYSFYFEFCFDPGVTDGGPFGFLTWSIPTLAGALACHYITLRGPRDVLKPFIIAAVALMVFGYALSCLTAIHFTLAGTGEPGLRAWFAPLPFSMPGPNIDLWTMSQKAGSCSYLIFAAGFSLAVYAICVLCCDLGQWEWDVFRTFGLNPLAAYILADLPGATVRNYLPYDCPAWWAVLMWIVFMILLYSIIRYLEKRGLYLRL